MKITLLTTSICLLASASFAQAIEKSNIYGQILCYQSDLSVAVAFNPSVKAVNNENLKSILKTLFSVKFENPKYFVLQTENCSALFPTVIFTIESTDVGENGVFAFISSLTIVDSNADYSKYLEGNVTTYVNNRYGFNYSNGNNLESYFLAVVTKLNNFISKLN